MNHLNTVKEMTELIPNCGVFGGGYLVVSSIKSVGCIRKEVLAERAEKNRHARWMRNILLCEQ